MADSPRIEELRRRVQRAPASIAFAQLAEEYRRAGQHAEAVSTCRNGLELHAGYLSARITLGRALLELGEIDDAERELSTVLRSAPENLAAIRGIAEIHNRRGELPKALEWFKIALGLAPNDPELEDTVNDLSRKLSPKRGSDDGLTLEQMKTALAFHAQAAPKPAELPILERARHALDLLNARAGESAEADVDIEAPEIDAHADELLEEPVFGSDTDLAVDATSGAAPEDREDPEIPEAPGHGALALDDALQADEQSPSDPQTVAEPQTVAVAASDASADDPQGDDTPAPTKQGADQLLALEDFLAAIHAPRSEPRP